MRSAIGAAMIGAGLLLAASARAEEPGELRAADLLDWFDRTLAAGAEASASPAPPPALGEGLVGRALSRLLGSGAEEAPADPQPAAPIVAASPAAAHSPAPVAAIPASAPDGAPLALVSDEARPTPAQSGGGLLLPLN